MTFTVTVQPSGRTFEVAHDETMLGAAIRQGLGLPYGCKDGACGSCKAELKEGRVIHGAHQAKALSPEEEAAGRILSCCALPQTDCTIHVPQVPSTGQYPVMKLPARVMRIERVATDVVILTLQLPAHQSFRYHPGQYIDVLLRDGARRSYSMATAPRDGQVSIELHIRHLPGGLFTDHVFGVMKDKEILRLEGPFGSFQLRNEADDASRPILLLASGTGFAPIQAILEALIAAGSTRPVALYWGGRRPADLYAQAAIERLQAALPQLRYVPVLSDALPEDGWGGRTGLVHQAVMADYPDLSAHQVYACGAPVMVEAAQRDFVAQCGLLAEQFLADAFTTAADRAAN